MGDDANVVGIAYHPTSLVEQPLDDGSCFLFGSHTVAILGLPLCAAWYALRRTRKAIRW